ncbi:hypothetical protein ACRAWF_38375 [Streptomyces sp. L7]
MLEQQDAPGACHRMEPAEIDRDEVQACPPHRRFPGRRHGLPARQGRPGTPRDRLAGDGAADARRRVRTRARCTSHQESMLARCVTGGPAPGRGRPDLARAPRSSTRKGARWSSAVRAKIRVVGLRPEGITGPGGSASIPSRMEWARRRSSRSRREAVARRDPGAAGGHAAPSSAGRRADAAKARRAAVTWRSTTRSVPQQALAARHPAHQHHGGDPRRSLADG